MRWEFHIMEDHTRTEKRSGGKMGLELSIAFLSTIFGLENNSGSQKITV